MNGLMMQQPLLVSTLLTHAERHHGSQQIVSRCAFVASRSGDIRVWRRRSAERQSLRRWN